MDFIDLKTQQARIKPELDKKIAEVLSHGRYILGPEVSALETELSEFCDAPFGLSCANGTDAIILALKALEIGKGDAVFCPSFTYCATAESIALVGAEPVFVDIDADSYNMCPISLERTISEIQTEGRLKPKAVIIVDLFGQCADYPALSPIAKKASLSIISDAAQGFGSTLNGKHPIHWADFMTTSFFPAKPLGCYGDGGAVFMKTKAHWNLIESLRFHGKSDEKYDTRRIGINSRLDSLQAAILQCKLNIFPDEISARNVVADIYTNGLTSLDIKTPKVIDGVISTWAQYTIEVQNPEALSQHLNSSNIPSARYYPRPTHLQTAYIDYPRDPAGLKVTETCMKTVLSLPMHAYLKPSDQAEILKTIALYNDR